MLLGRTLKGSGLLLNMELHLLKSGQQLTRPLAKVTVQPGHLESCMGFSPAMVDNLPLEGVLGAEAVGKAHVNLS